MEARFGRGEKAPAILAQTWGLKWLAVGSLLVLAVLGVAISIMMRRAEPMLRELIVDKLQEHFHARVELASFHISLVNGLWAEGRGLEIWPPSEVVGVTVPGAASSSPPLIRLKEFRFHAPLHYKPGKPIRISMVELNGLEVNVPPKTHFTHLAKDSAPGSGSEPAGSSLLRLELDSIECKDAHLTLETSKPGKLPLEFDIDHIKLTGMNTGGAMHFEALLTNPRPAGIIHSSGRDRAVGGRGSRRDAGGRQLPL